VKTFIDANDADIFSELGDFDIPVEVQEEFKWFESLAMSWVMEWLDGLMEVQA
jgi:hypothetical protein